VSEAPTVKPWMKQPGELHDMNGIPIYPGDLLKSFHFVGRRRKRHYVYHTAVFKGGAMRMVPTCHLEPTKVSGGGACLMDQALMNHAEVISGHGPGDCLDHTDRKKVL
jgi:hypothetical protein